MKTERDMKLESQVFNANTSKLIEPIEIKNSYYNFHLIYSAITEKRAKEVAALRIDKPEPILNFGSGPSMEDAMPYLKDWKGKIMCGTSQATTLKHAGIDPDFLVLLDPQTLLEELAEVDTWEGSKTKLITHTNVMPDLLEYWPREMYFYREFNPQKEFYWRILPVAYDFIDTYMFLFSCSAAAQVGLAAYMGYSPQFLVGMDFSMPGNRSRCPRWYYDREMPKKLTLQELAATTAESFPGEWKVTPTLPMIPEHTIMSINGVPTNDMQIFYKRALMSIYRVDRPQLINTCKENMMFEFPCVPMKEVVITQGYGYEQLFYTDEKIRRIADEYIATRNQFAIEFGTSERKGEINTRFVESYNPFIDLPRYMNRLNDQIRGQMPDATLEDDLIDVDANMARIETLKPFISFPTSDELKHTLFKDGNPGGATSGLRTTDVKTEEDAAKLQEQLKKSGGRVSSPVFIPGNESTSVDPTGNRDSMIKTPEDVERWKENIKKIDEKVTLAVFPKDAVLKEKEPECETYEIKVKKARVTGGEGKGEDVRTEELPTDDPQDRRRKREIVTRDKEDD